MIFVFPFILKISSNHLTYTEFLYMLYRLILPKINYHLIQLNIFLIWKLFIPLVFTVEPKVVFRLNILHFRSTRQLFISMLTKTTQQHIAQQRRWTICWCKVEVSFVHSFRSPLFFNCLLCIPSHARREQTAGLRGGNALFNYALWVRLFILVLFLGQLILIF